ncbi:hypothetical protein B1B_08860, partial [mine drainage metagenome]
MIPGIVFRYPSPVCPECNTRLLAYRTERRTVRSYVMGEFTAIHKLMKCRIHGTVFRSDRLESLIEPYCTYANDVMIEAAMKRFIDGRSCSEISLQHNMGGISESHARHMTNMALDISTQIHEKSYPKLRSAINSYILQID